MGAWKKIGNRECVVSLVNVGPEEEEPQAVEMVTLEDAEAAVASDRSRIRKELLAWAADTSYPEDGVGGEVVRADWLSTALDRICSEEG